MLILRERSTVHPITLSMVKAHLRLDCDDEDDFLNILIAIATEMVESHIGLSLIQKTWCFRMLPDDSGIIEAVLPAGPLIDVDCVMRLLPCGKRIPFRRYSIDQTGNRSVLKCRSYVPVEVIYSSGFGRTPLSVPAMLQQAIIVLVSHFYENRLADMSVPPLVRQLLLPYKTFFFQTL
jgi:uncharacterized phiE125 gp8 family phage protein